MTKMTKITRQSMNMQLWCSLVVTAAVTVLSSNNNVVMATATGRQLRTTPQRHLQETEAPAVQQCVPPGGEIPCSSTADGSSPLSDGACGTCCFYDPTDLSVFLEVDDAEATAIDSQYQQGCHALLDVDGITPTACLCGPEETIRDADAEPVEEEVLLVVAVTDIGSESPSAAPVAEAPTVTLQPTPLKEGACLSEGAKVDADPVTVCNYGDCCSGYCGCTSNVNSISCRCSPVQ